jgi:hypothetical protein
MSGVAMGREARVREKRYLDAGVPLASCGCCVRRGAAAREAGQDMA